MPLYSVFPVYGDASVNVLEAENLCDAIEKAFNAKLISIQDVVIDIEESVEFKDTCAMYGVIAALGKRNDGYNLLCGATVITYTTTKARIALDLASVAGLRPARYAV